MKSIIMLDVWGLYIICEIYLYQGVFFGYYLFVI